MRLAHTLVLRTLLSLPSTSERTTSSDLVQNLQQLSNSDLASSEYQDRAKLCSAEWILINKIKSDYEDKKYIIKDQRQKILDLRAENKNTEVCRRRIKVLGAEFKRQLARQEYAYKTALTIKSQQQFFETMIDCPMNKTKYLVEHSVCLQENTNIENLLKNVQKELFDMKNKTRF